LLKTELAQLARSSCFAFINKALSYPHKEKYDEVLTLIRNMMRLMVSQEAKKDA
jgi:hypothetical protein